jgi:hypothetical protein
VINEDITGDLIAMAAILHDWPAVCRYHMPDPPTYIDRLDPRGDLVCVRPEPIQNRQKDSKGIIKKLMLFHAGRKSAVG